MIDCNYHYCIEVKFDPEYGVNWHNRFHSNKWDISVWYFDRVELVKFDWHGA